VRLRRGPRLGWGLIGCAAIAIGRVGAQSPVSVNESPGSDHAHNAARQTPATDAVTDSLLHLARTAAEQFVDRNAAIAAGYRRLGMDFPSMGEHWVNPRLVIEGKFDIVRPAMLTYVTVRGKPVVTGIVYAVPLERGEAPPAAFGAVAVWHEHNGTVNEESLLPEHHSAASSSGSGTRLAILHAWVGSPNPAGPFAAENWALPFVRLGLRPPDRFPDGAARTLSLLSGGDRYYLELIRSWGGLPTVSAALSDCAAVASRIAVPAVGADRELSAGEVRELDQAWTTLVGRVAGIAGPDAARRINGGVLPTERGPVSP